MNGRSRPFHSGCSTRAAQITRRLRDIDRLVAEHQKTIDLLQRERRKISGELAALPGTNPTQSGDANVSA